MAEDLKIGGRRVWMHKAIVAPDLKTEHVLSRDPWLYVELWLTREKLTKAASYWSQAKRFADATEPPPTKVEGFSVLEHLRCTVDIFSD